MFNTPKHEHKSTGIASGLEYRPGYKVGGRVGYALGDRVRVGQTLDVNPDLDIDNTYYYPDTATKLPKFESKTIRGKETTPTLPDAYERMIEADPNLSLYDPLNPSEMHGPLIPRKIGRRKYWEEEGIAKQYFGDEPDYGDLTEHMRVKTEFKDKNGEDAPTITTKEDAKNLYDDFFRTDALINKNREELDVELQKLRNEQDLKSKELAEKFNKATKTESILAGLAAANDPNLKKGQSRVASGVSAFAERAAVGKRERLDRAEKDQATKFLRAESDLATKFSRVEDDIKREKDLKDYGHKLSLAKKYDPDQTAALQEINYLLDQFGVEPGSKQHETIAINRILGNPLKEKDYSDLRNTIAEKMQEINATGSPNEYRRLIGIPERFDINGEEVDLDVQDRLLAEQMMISGATLEERQEEANGGRVGYAIGGQVTKETLAPEEVAAVSNELNNNEVPLIMNYSQLRKRLPEFIDDEIVSLIAHSPNAFKDFAIIDNQADVEEFNEKYDVRLELPDADRMDFTDAEKTTSAPMPVTVPSAVAADPNIMPMQRGTGQLTPTEVALLSPMEQAIKMRSG